MPLDVRFGEASMGLRRWGAAPSIVPLGAPTAVGPSKALADGVIAMEKPFRHSYASANLGTRPEP